MFKFLILFLISPILLTVNFAYSKLSVFPIKNKGRGAGTAFYIGEGKFVTNFHVVETDKQSFYTIATSDKFNPLAKIIHLDAKNDLAVLKVDPEFIQTLEESITPLTLSEAPNLIKNSKYKTVAIDYYNYDEAKRVQHDIEFNNFNQDLEGSEMQFISIRRITSGMSGSPILDKKNQVIGILCCATGVIGFATPVAKLLALLKTQQLECESDLECIKQEIKNLKEQAHNNNIDALYELAKYYKFGKGGMPQDLTKAMDLYKQAAEQGHSSAQNILGDMYQYGYGVPNKDLTKAVYWYKKAAAQGNKQAQKTLQKIELEKQKKEVVEKLLKTIQAAEQYNSDAQKTLGDMYRYGNGVLNKDLTKAVYWYKQSATQGNQHAKKILQKIELEKLLKTIPAAL